jgi:sterol desaturase/sphingolipid hydroxylase (fatty acid hydroxylase superfamily)
MYERVILWATPVFFLAIAIEIAIGSMRRRQSYRAADAINSINIGALSTYSGVFTRLVNTGIYIAVWDRARVVTLPADAPWVWASGLLLYDFLYYWFHRMSHEVNVLWAAHVVHHQSEEFNLSTALRQTSTGFLFSWIFYLPMALLGFPPQLFVMVALIDLLYQFWIHTEQVGSLGLFDRIFASPSNHRVHHGANSEYLDRNYGGLLIIWDRLFGTFQPELATVPVVYGTRDPLRSWNPLWANLHTYWTLALDSVRALTWRDRLLIWLHHPGWRPKEVAARDPKPAFTLAAFHKFEKPIPAALAVYCVAQSVVMLGFGTHFLAKTPQLSPSAALAYLLGLMVSLWIIGGLSEGRRAFVWLEAGRLAILAAGVITWLGDTHLTARL